MDVPTKLSYNFESQLRYKNRAQYRKLWQTPQYQSASKAILSKEQNYIDAYLFSELLSLETCKHLSEIYPQISVPELVLDVRKRFYDPKLMLLLGCLTTITSKTPYEGDYTHLNSKIFWDGAKKIGEGVYGSVYTSQKDSLKRSFVLKYNRNNDQSIHETFISLLLNKYRAVIPNFMYGFGYFKCLQPLATLNKDVNSICDLKGDSYYGVYEYVSKTTLERVFLDRNLTLIDFLNFYLQILLALWSVRELKYSHNDLHLGNVLMRKTKTSLIPYSYRSGTLYLRTNLVATIIDFGYNYVEYQGQSYGVFKGELVGAFPDRPNYIYDAYKFFMYSAYTMNHQWSKYNQKLVPLLEPIFQFLRPGLDLKKTLQDEYATGYTIQDPNNTYDHTQMIDFILNNYKEINNSLIYTEAPSGVPILGCRDGVCLESSLEIKQYLQSVKIESLDLVSFWQETNSRTPIEQTLLKYKSSVLSLSESNFRKLLQLIRVIQLRINNTIIPTLKLIPLQFDLAAVLTLSDLYPYLNSVYDNFTEATISKDLLVHFHLYHPEELKEKRNLLLRFLNDFDKRKVALLTVVQDVTNLISKNKDFIRNVWRDLDLKQPEQRIQNEKIKRVYEIYNIATKYVRYLKQTPVGYYDVKDVYVS